ncbi:MAG TPA: TonB-dependent receptor, partial [Acidobacteriota bacterium]|nr:TonB-dependent receptor [Acidobacteriota bacterium]
YNGVSASGVAGLVANAGHYNTALADNASNGSGYGFGLRSPLAQGIRLRGLSFSARRAMLSNLEAYVNFDFRTNRSTSDLGTSDGLVLTLPSTAPTNPFASTVYVNVPTANSKHGLFSESETRDFVTGLKLSLPREWTVVGEFHYARSNFNYEQWTHDGPRLNADIASGAFDILRDLPALGLDLAQYRGLLSSRNASTLTEFTGRASGTAWELPGGSLRSTFVVGTRRQGNKQGETLTEYENYATDFSRSITLPRHIVDDSYAAEINVPVFGRKFAFPLLESLELQVAGRYDDYHSVQRSYAGNFTSTITTRAITSSSSRYSSDNQTYGLTWKPVRDVMIRSSYSTAFTPPDPSDLLPTTLTTTTKTTITDSLRGNSRYIVESLGSGNPNLKPEESESATVGVVFTPRWVPGLRLAADYSHINRYNARGSLSVQQLINYEAYFPERITRAAPASGDAYSVGAITFVDTSYLNLLKTQSIAYNVRADYGFRTAIGNWTIGGVASSLQHYRVQTVFRAPLTEMIGNQSQSSYLIPKWKGNATLTWERGPWKAGWTARYYSHYLQSATYQAAQGSRFVPAQTYHDVYLAYQFPSRGANRGRVAQWLANTSVQFGVKNVFSTEPPYDVSSYLGYSAYGDVRLASYWLSLKKEF